MKTLKITATLALSLGLLTVGTAFGADNANSTIGAEIVPALAISNTGGLDFGQIAPSGSAGTVTISPAGGRSSSNVTLGNVTTVSAASFAVSGANNNTYAITLPTSVDIDDGATHIMSVDTFVSSPSVGAGGLLDGTGAQVLTVGATLNVGINQVVGDYNGTFNVSVAYN